MRPFLVGVLAIFATAPTYVLGRLVAYFFQDARGGSFVGQFFWEFTAGGFAAMGAFGVTEWLLADHVAKRATHLVVMTIVLTVLILLTVLAMSSNYSYNGSTWEAAGGLIGLSLGFAMASLVARAQ